MRRRRLERHSAVQPSPLASPAALPPDTEVRSTSIVSRPGVTLMTAATPAKARTAVSTPTS
jgi:hypothetical protein